MYEIKGDCIPPHSLENNCTPCLESKQCKKGGFCCPFMKKCVKTSTQLCTYPIAECRPPCHDVKCTSCKKYYKEGTWQKKTC